MGQYVDFYCGDENKELKKIVNPILIRRFAWIPQKDYDDFYSIAAMVVWDCEEKFDGKKVKTKKFKSFVSTCIHNKVKSYITHMNRDKRIAKDEDGNPLHNSSLDAPTEDGINLCERVSSDFKVENKIKDFSYTSLEDILEECSPQMREYLNITLSNLQRKILELIINDYSKEKIMKTLHIDSALYSDSIAAITSKRNTRNLRKALEEKKNVR